MSNVGEDLDRLGPSRHKTEAKGPHGPRASVSKVLP